ncbi:MAG: anti-sigma factor family protein [Gemmatimonadaceae bacterium]
MNHLTFDQLSALAEGPEPQAQSAEHHLAQCAECRETLAKLRQLIAAAHALPRDVAPPPEVWTALRSRVSHQVPRARAQTRWMYGGWIAAAAVVVLAVGMNVLMPARSNKAKAAKVAATPATPVLVLAVDRNYLATVAELRLTLESQRSTLSPATIRVLEHSLAAIDAAIAEAREALADDPANQMLVGILSANYERKVELLKRATELSSSS